MEHVRGREVAPVPGCGDEPGRVPAELAGRARIRTVLRLPRVPRPISGIPIWSTTTTRSSSRSRRRTATTSPTTSPTRRCSSSGTRRRSRRTSRSSSTTRRVLRTRRTMRRRSGSSVTAADSTWGTRRSAHQILARQKELGIVPANTEVPDINPDRYATDPYRSGRQAVPDHGLHQAVGLTRCRRAALVRPDGRGVRRLPVARRPPHRTRCSTTSKRPGCGRTPW